MHHVVLEIQESNKDVLVGKRNLNCLSCGIKDGVTLGPSTAHSTIAGKDGRVYRGFGQGITLDEKSTTNLGQQQSRVASANPRANRFSDFGGVKQSYDAMSSNQGGKRLQPPYGIHTEVRKRLPSRTGLQNQHMTASHQLDSKSMTGLSHNYSAGGITTNITGAANTSGTNPGHQRKKLPIGFLVQ